MAAMRLPARPSGLRQSMTLEAGAQGDSLGKQNIQTLPARQQQQSQYNRLNAEKSTYEPLIGKSLTPSRSRSPLRSNLTRKSTKPSILRQSMTRGSEFSVVVPSPPKVRRRTHNFPLGMSPPPTKSRHAKENSELSETPPPNKRRGRPPRTTSKESSSSDVRQPKRIGRPSMAETLARRAQEAKEKAAIIPLKYIPFLCEWKGCRAELHNLDTLRKHVRTVHTKAQSYSMLCQWGKCGLTSHPQEFDNLEHLSEHVQEEHMVPFAWHMGEGPRGSTLDGSDEPDPSAYLSDATGRIVTPSVVGQKIEYGSAFANHARRIRKGSEIESTNAKPRGRTAKRTRSSSPSHQASPTSNFGSLRDVLRRQKNGEVQRWEPPKGLLKGKSRAESTEILKSWGEPWLFDGSITPDEQRRPRSAKPIPLFPGQEGEPHFVGRDFSEWKRQMGMK